MPSYSAVLFLLFGLIASCRNANKDGKHVDKPNVIIILSDDQGWGDFSIHGNTNLNTPNIDNIEKTGRDLKTSMFVPYVHPPGQNSLQAALAFAEGSFLPPRAVNGLTWMKQPLPMSLKKQDTKQRLMANGTMACNTMQPHAWGYDKSNDGKHKSAEVVIDMLENAKKMNDNLLLNVGPKGDGTLPEEDVKALTKAGKMLREKNFFSD